MITANSWLLLLFSLPTNRNTERVAVWRRLKKMGAVQIKTSTYLLPDEPAQYRAVPMARKTDSRLWRRFDARSCARNRGPNQREESSRSSTTHVQRTTASYENLFRVSSLAKKKWMPKRQARNLSGLRGGFGKFAQSISSTARADTTWQCCFGARKDRSGRGNWKNWT